MATCLWKYKCITTELLKFTERLRLRARLRRAGTMLGSSLTKSTNTLT